MCLLEYVKFAKHNWANEADQGVPLQVVKGTEPSKVIVQTCNRPFNGEQFKGVFFFSFGKNIRL